ncbi:MAG: adenylate/guanylate cyclase domain-containing protein [Deltaproteobacteria bacterium]|nr:adenylate/guanylate cyclase domain-containing protein [Deltaproteobacteria bacterium]
MEGPPTLAPQTAAPAKLSGVDAPDVELVTALVTGQVLRESDIDLVPAAFDERGGGFVCDVLLERGLITETNLLRFFATHLRTRFVVAEKLAAATIEPECLERLPVRLAEELGAIPLWWDAKQETLSCIVAVPLTGQRLSRLRQAVQTSGGKQLHVFLATWSAVAAAQQKHYYANAQAFDDFAASGAGPPPERAPQEPGPEEKSEKTRVLFQNEHENLLALRQENVRFRIAQEFHRRVQVLRGLGPQLEAIVELVFDLLTCDTVVLELSDGTKAHRSHFDDPDTQIPRSLVEEALQSPEGLLRNGIGLDGRATSESVSLKGIKSAMVMPLATPTGNLGILYLESLSAPAAFDENDRKMLAGVAAQASAVIQNSTLLDLVEREAEARTHLSRFLPPQLVDQAVTGGIDLKLESRNTTATILYADIRGFTRATGQLGAEAIVRALTGFYEEMTEAVFERQGMVDKFMGDCVMAVWGAPLPVPEHAHLALLAAREMMQRASRLQLGDAPLRLGIGVASGTVVAGAIGGSRRMDYTVIGPAVNIAARLCDLAHGGQILTTAQTLRAAGKELPTEQLPPTPLKGVAEALDIHRVLWSTAQTTADAPATTDLAKTGTDPFLPVARSFTPVAMPAMRPPAPAAAPAPPTPPSPTDEEDAAAAPTQLGMPVTAAPELPAPSLGEVPVPEYEASPPPTVVSAPVPLPPRPAAPVPPPQAAVLPPAPAPEPLAAPPGPRATTIFDLPPASPPPAPPGAQAPAPAEAPAAADAEIDVDLDLEEEPPRLENEHPPLPQGVPWVDTD